MRDWDRNGRIDGRDYYLFHEEIMKDHSESDDEPAYASNSSSYRRAKTTNTSNPEKKKSKEIGCLPILLVNVILYALLEILKSI